MTESFLVFKATKIVKKKDRAILNLSVSKVLTFYRNDQLWYYWQDLLTPASRQQIINTLKTTLSDAGCDGV